MTAFRNPAGEIQQLPLSVDMHRQAADNGQSFAQYVNTHYPTDPAKYGTTFQQLLIAEGIYLSSNPSLGIRASKMSDVLNGMPRYEAGTIVKDAVPASRILFPPAILQAIEDKLQTNLDMAPMAFEKLIAVDDTITGDRFDRPVLNFSKPEAARTQAISQLALPASMLSITVSDVSRKIPTRSIGMEISDQALQATSLDIVSLALARQRAVERNERTYEYILALLNGDADNGQAALSTISNKVVKASVYDSSIVAAGVLTQTAWMKWLFTNSLKRNITHIITNLAGALAIENRSGKPVITGDNPNSNRIDTLMSVLNPTWPASVPIFITQDPNWPANTIMGIDSAYAIHRVSSTTASYQAIEAFVLKRSQAMRFDSGEIVYRLFDEAFEVLSLIP